MTEGEGHLSFVKCLPEFKPNPEQLRLLESYVNSETQPNSQAEARLQAAISSGNFGELSGGEVQSGILSATNELQNENSPANKEAILLRIRQMEARRIELQGGPRIQVASGENKPVVGESFLTLEGVKELYGKDPSRWPRVNIWDLGPDSSKFSPKPKPETYNSPLSPTGPVPPSGSGSVSTPTTHQLAPPASSTPQIQGANASPGSAQSTVNSGTNVHAPTPVEQQQSQASSVQEQQDWIRQQEEERKQEEARRELARRRADLQLSLDSVISQQTRISEEIRKISEKLVDLDHQPIWGLFGRIGLFTDLINNADRAELNQELVTLNATNQRLLAEARSLQERIQNLR